MSQVTEKIIYSMVAMKQAHRSLLSIEKLFIISHGLLDKMQ